MSEELIPVTWREFFEETIKNGGRFLVTESVRFVEITPATPDEHVSTG